MRIEDWLGKASIFAGLGRQELEELAALASLKTFAQKETIFLEDDPGDALYILRTGAVKIFRVSADGREQILAVLHPGELFGEMAVLQGATRSAAAQALVESTVLVFPQAEFRRFLAQQPQGALQCIAVLCSRLRRANRSLELLLWGNVRQRLYAALGEMADKEDEIELTHQDLGALVGSSRETITRILLELQAFGCVSAGRGWLQITDWDKVREVLLGEEFEN